MATLGLASAPVADAGAGTRGVANGGIRSTGQLIEERLGFPELPSIEKTDSAREEAQLPGALRRGCPIRFVAPTCCLRHSGVCESVSEWAGWAQPPLVGCRGTEACALLLPQRLHRIHPAGPSRRHKTRNQSAAITNTGIITANVPTPPGCIPSTSSLASRAPRRKPPPPPGRPRRKSSPGSAAAPSTSHPTARAPSAIRTPISGTLWLVK